MDVFPTCRRWWVSGEERRVDSVIGGSIEAAENIFAESIKRKSDLPSPPSSNFPVSGSLGNGKKSPFLEREVALPRCRLRSIDL